MARNGQEIPGNKNEYEPNSWIARKLPRKGIWNDQLLVKKMATKPSSEVAAQTTWFFIYGDWGRRGNVCCCFNAKKEQKSPKIAD